MVESWLVRGQTGEKPRIVVYCLTALGFPPSDKAGAGRDIDLSLDGFWSGIK